MNFGNRKTILNIASYLGPSKGLYMLVYTQYICGTKISLED